MAKLTSSRLVSRIIYLFLSLQIFCLLSCSEFGGNSCGGLEDLGQSAPNNCCPYHTSNSTEKCCWKTVVITDQKNPLKTSASGNQKGSVFLASSQTVLLAKQKLEGQICFVFVLIPHISSKESLSLPNRSPPIPII